MSTKNANATKTDSPVKKSKKEGKSEKLSTKNVDKTASKAKEKEAEEEASERTLKYQYPAEIKTASQKKEFRRKARAQRDRLQKALRKFRKDKSEEGVKNYAAAEKDWNKFMKTVISDGYEA